jgi:hypothetical protein
MRSVLFASGLCAVMVAASPQSSVAEEPSVVDTTHSTGAQRGSCEAEATKRGLAGSLRAGFIADCLKPKPAPGAAAAPAPDRKQFRRSRQECRDYASKMRRLWGLARHKYVKRCRAGRNVPGVPPLR